MLGRRGKNNQERQVGKQVNIARVTYWTQQLWRGGRGGKREGGEGSREGILRGVAGRARDRGRKQREGRYIKGDNLKSMIYIRRNRHTEENIHVYIQVCIYELHKEKQRLLKDT